MSLFKCEVAARCLTTFPASLAPLLVPGLQGCYCVKDDKATDSGGWQTVSESLVKLSDAANLKSFGGFPLFRGIGLDCQGVYRPAGDMLIQNGVNHFLLLHHGFAFKAVTYHNGIVMAAFTIHRCGYTIDSVFYQLPDFIWLHFSAQYPDFGRFTERLHCTAVYPSTIANRRSKPARNMSTVIYLMALSFLFCRLAMTLSIPDLRISLAKLVR